MFLVSMQVRRLFQVHSCFTREKKSASLFVRHFCVMLPSRSGVSLIYRVAKVNSQFTSCEELTCCAPWLVGPHEEQARSQ